MSKSTTVTLRTEVWGTRKGAVAKAVARTKDGKFLGATNQTGNVGLTLVGRK